jgi:hypothetical protein
MDWNFHKNSMQNNTGENKQRGHFKFKPFVNIDLTFTPSQYINNFRLTLFHQRGVINLEPLLFINYALPIHNHGEWCF